MIDIQPYSILPQTRSADLPLVIKDITSIQTVSRIHLYMIEVIKDKQ